MVIAPVKAVTDVNWPTKLVPTVQLPLLALDPGPPLVGALASALESAGGLW